LAIALWSARDEHASVELNGEMWVLGGRSGILLLNDVYAASDIAALGGYFLFQKQ
jgi:hypothetical protein